MDYFYDNETGAFFVDGIHVIPDDAIPVREEEYQLLVNGRAKGRDIILMGNTLTLTPPRPSIYHVWDANAWVIDDEKKAEIKAYLQNRVWSEIKQKRYNNGRLGVYVKSVDKWFHSDDASRQQYTFMRTLADFPPTQWKTMDNTFVTMTKDLLNELSLAMFTNEQADFVNAEKHRLAMLETDNPQDYDYSTGWREVYHGE